MSESLSIENGVPIPASRRGRQGIPWKNMAVGDSVFAAGREQNTVAATGRLIGKKHSPRRKFVTRKVTEDGVAGVRVWRVE